MLDSKAELLGSSFGRRWIILAKRTLLSQWREKCPPLYDEWETTLTCGWWAGHKLSDEQAWSVRVHTGPFHCCTGLSRLEVTLVIQGNQRTVVLQPEVIFKWSLFVSVLMFKLSLTFSSFKKASGTNPTLLQINNCPFYNLQHNSNAAYMFETFMFGSFFLRKILQCTESDEFLGSA